MSVFKKTTTVEAERTISEIAQMLVPRGATAIMTEYDDQRRVTSVSFKMRVGANDAGFRLPCEWKPVLTLLLEDPKLKSKEKTEDQAVRVAWRIVHAWIEAQMALVDVSMVKMRTVFLPYLVMGDGKTLAEHVEKDPKFLLGDGK